MKVSKRDVMIIMIVVGVLAVALTYFYVFSSYQEKTEDLVAQNVKLQQQINDLQNKQQNQGFYETEMERMLNAIDDIYQVFPVDVREEDVILLGINQEIISPMELNSISISLVSDVDFTVDTAQTEREYTYGLGEGDVLGVEDEVAAEAPTQTNDPTSTTGMLRNRQATYNYTVSYEGLKRSIQHICNQTNRVAIDSLTASFDTSTGLLVGSTTLNMYLVPDQDKPYVQPNFSAVLLGTDNIFGTIVINSEANLPDVEDMEGAEEGEGGETAE
ncbi:MAG: hypothetical protein NC313_14505 [Butyrivibrio sp.]|nr:hypothetical protein [Butyrivibrio sp.]MCM1263919.1 hypothetical protein [Butyrivibrio sp.]